MRPRPSLVVSPFILVMRFNQVNECIQIPAAAQGDSPASSRWRRIHRLQSTSVGRMDQTRQPPQIHAQGPGDLRSSPAGIAILSVRAKRRSLQRRHFICIGRICRFDTLTISPRQPMWPFSAATRLADDGCCR